MIYKLYIVVKNLFISMTRSMTARANARKVKTENGSVQPPPPPNCRELASLLIRPFPLNTRQKSRHNSQIWLSSQHASLLNLINSWGIFEQSLSCEVTFTLESPLAPCSSLTRVEARVGGKLDRWGSLATKSSHCIPLDIFTFDGQGLQNREYKFWD